MADGKPKILGEIQRTIEKGEQDRRKELFRQRLELARTGVKNFQERKLGDAAKAFYSYLRILEDYKGVAENGLTPNLFDRARELPELLLISGVYWDLAKMYDQTEGKKREFLIYLEKYLIFSKGMPYQIVAAETLRKYIYKGRPRNRADFQRTYTALTGSKCFIATSLIDVCDERTLFVLRDFRDQRLMRVWWGRVFVRAYYIGAPAVAWLLDRAPAGVRRLAARIVDGVAGGLAGTLRRSDSSSKYLGKRGHCSIKRHPSIH